MEYRIWHGTNQSFDSFEAGMLGMNTDNASSRRAFYFTDCAEAAWDYAEFAARNLIPNQKSHDERVAELLKAAQRASDAGNHDQYEHFTAWAEELEFSAMQATPSGATLLLCSVHLENLLVVDAGGGRLHPDIGNMMDRARSAGHDGIVFRGIHDTPTGAGPACDHFAVFDVAAIEIVERHYELVPDQVPEMAF